MVGFGVERDFPEMKRSGMLLVFAAAVLLAVNAYGAITGFPVMDDGELLTTAREAGPSALITTNRDRPINAWLIHASYVLFAERRRLWVATAAVFWAVFAWQTARFVRRVLPGGSGLAGLCALLVLAPLVVEMQHTTLTFVFAAMLPVVLAFEALLLTLSPERDRDLGPLRLALAAALVAAGALVSEYSVAATVPAVVFLVVLARFRGALALAVGAGVGLLGFRSIADLNARPDTMPAVQAARLAGRAAQLPARWLSGVWYTLVGAYGSAAGAIKLDLATLSSIFAAAVGLGCAAAVAWAYRREPADARPARWREFLAMCAAVAVGVSTTVLASRIPDAGNFHSRFRLPILPFAVAATAYAAERVVRPRWRSLPGILLAFLAGFTAVTAAFQMKRVQSLYDDIADRVRPIARASHGLTVVVLVDPGYSVPWAKLQARYGLDDEKRTWAFSDGNATRIFGPRGACHDTDYLDVEPTLRTIGREGSIAKVVWAYRTWGDQIRLEPYCVATPLGGAVSTPLGGEAASTSGTAAAAPR
jgi:hypothetical protein